MRLLACAYQTTTHPCIHDKRVSLIKTCVFCFQPTELAMANRLVNGSFHSIHPFSPCRPARNVTSNAGTPRPLCDGLTGAVSLIGLKGHIPTTGSTVGHQYRQVFQTKYQQQYRPDYRTGRVIWSPVSSCCISTQLMVENKRFHWANWQVKRAYPLGAVFLQSALCCVWPVISSEHKPICVTLCIHSIFVSTVHCCDERQATSARVMAGMELTMHRLHIAVFSYEAQEGGDLSLREGEKVRVTETIDVNWSTVEKKMAKVALKLAWCQRM